MAWPNFMRKCYCEGTVGSIEAYTSVITAYYNPGFGITVAQDNEIGQIRRCQPCKTIAASNRDGKRAIAAAAALARQAGRGCVVQSVHITARASESVCCASVCWLLHRFPRLACAVCRVEWISNSQSQSYLCFFLMKTI